MKKHIFTVALLFVSIFSANAQDWVFGKQAGGTLNDYGQSITVDGSGNSYIAGYFEGTASFGSVSLTSSGEKDIFVAKYDPSGNVLWVKKAGGTSIDEAKGIAVDASGNVYVTGSFVTSATFGTTSLSSSGWADIFIAKYDASGNEVWAKKAGGVFADEGYAIALDGSGNIYITGSFSMTATFGSTSITVAELVNTTDVFIAKYDASGNIVYAKRAGGGVYGDIAYGIGVDAFSNVYITGKYYWSATFGSTILVTGGTYDSDVFVAKYDVSGNSVWAKRAGRTTTLQSSYDQGNAIAVDAAGNAFVTGNFLGTAYFGTDSIVSTTAPFEDIFIAKYDSAGKVLWVRKAGGGSTDYGYGITIDGLGNAYTTGSFVGEATFDSISISCDNQDAFIAKYDALGNILYVKKSKGVGLSSATGRSIALTGSGSVYITGEFGFNPYPTSTVFGSDSLTSAGQLDVFVAKISSSVTGIAKHRHNVKVDIYPNPASSFISLSLESNILATISIKNIFGSLVFQQNIQQSQYDINIESLKNGVYLITVETEKGISTQKFIKQ